MRHTGEINDGMSVPFVPVRLMAPCANEGVIAHTACFLVDFFFKTFAPHPKKITRGQELVNKSLLDRL